MRIRRRRHMFPSPVGSLPDSIDMPGYWMTLVRLLLSLRIRVQPMPPVSKLEATLSKSGLKEHREQGEWSRTATAIKVENFVEYVPRLGVI